MKKIQWKKILIWTALLGGGYFLARPAIAKSKIWFNVDNPDNLIMPSSGRITSINLMGLVTLSEGTKGKLNFAANRIVFDGGAIWASK